MDEQQFGAAGARLVIEECLVGPEVSFFALCDGTRAIPIASAQDHKRIFDDDQGPNTGGMGAFAPSPLLDASDRRRASCADIVEPVLRGMRAEGTEYRGFLYAGLMMTCAGPEGDRIQRAVRRSRGAGRHAAHRRRAAAAAGRRGGRRSRRSARRRCESGVSVGVVLASAGYPGPVTTGAPIGGLDAASQLPGVTIFHSGTALADEAIVTAGGRVLTVVGTGSDYRDFRKDSPVPSDSRTTTATA